MKIVVNSISFKKMILEKRLCFLCQKSLWAGYKLTLRMRGDDIWRVQALKRSFGNDYKGENYATIEKIDGSPQTTIFLVVAFFCSEHAGIIPAIKHLPEYGQMDTIDLEDLIKSWRERV